MSTRCRFIRITDLRPIEILHTDLGPFPSRLEGRLYRSVWSWPAGDETKSITIDCPADQAETATGRVKYEVELLEREHNLRFIEVIEHSVR